MYRCSIQLNNIHIHIHIYIYIDMNVIHTSHVYIIHYITLWLCIVSHYIHVDIIHTYIYIYTPYTIYIYTINIQYIIIYIYIYKSIHIHVCIYVYMYIHICIWLTAYLLAGHLLLCAAIHGSFAEHWGGRAGRAGAQHVDLTTRNIDVAMENHHF